MKLKFYGAAETVTGSCYYLESQNMKFLVDCGMYQGKEVQARNFEDFEFNPRDLDFVILTHAHIDHSGLLPKLYKFGFRGTVYTTPATASITRMLLLDSAKIQEKNQLENDFKANGPIIYGTNDALGIINQFESINYFDKVKLAEKSYFYYIPAGHILGAAGICLEVDNVRVIFSGDIGRIEQSIIKNFLECEYTKFNPQYIISESLYGSTVHESRQITTRKLLDIINKTIDRNGNVIIPSFAVHRTQELIEILKFAMLKKEINNNVQIYLDSPMAIGVTEIYTANNSAFNHEYIQDNLIVAFDDKKLEDKYLYRFNASNSNRLKFDNLRFVRKSKQSLKLMSSTRNIVIAGSGMADGGRVVHHLYSGLENANNSVIFVGYQAEDTLGRLIVKGTSPVLINDKQIKVRAEIHYLRGFSAHADMNDIQIWLEREKTDLLKQVFLVHAEPEIAILFADTLNKKGYNVVIPKYKQEFILN